MNFDVDINNLHEIQCKNDPNLGDKLNTDVIQSYFRVTQKDIDEFKNDLFLPLAEYSVFKEMEEEESKKKEERDGNTKEASEQQDN